MPRTRAELTEKVHDLELRLPALIGEWGTGPEFWNAFAGLTDFVTEDASAADVDWLNQEVDQALRRQGVDVPKDESPTDG